MWGQFAKNLGGESLDNMSLLAALQPADIKEAIEATQGNPISRTKLRLVFAVARMMFGMDPVDVGAPVAASAGAEPKTKGCTHRYRNHTQNQGFVHPGSVFRQGG